MTIKKGSKVRVLAACKQPHKPEGIRTVRRDPWLIFGKRVVLLEGSAAAWPVEFLEVVGELG